MTTPLPLMIFGCGYLGSVVARLARSSAPAEGRTMFALTRSRTKQLEAAGITPIVADVTDEASLTALEGLPQLGMIVYCIGYDRSTGRSMREIYIDGLARVAKRCDAKSWVYVSSTSVYGQQKGEWVTEESETMPIEASGEVVLAAEAALMQLRPHATRLRFAGIYGPGRILRRDALKRGEPLRIDPDHYLNLIHVVDGAHAILACEACPGSSGEVINICDDTPSTRREIYTETARLLHAPEAVFAQPLTGTKESNRRLSNAKAKRLLGWAPRYPSYREGLAAALAAEAS